MEMLGDSRAGNGGGRETIYIINNRPYKRPPFATTVLSVVVFVVAYYVRHVDVD